MSERYAPTRVQAPQRRVHPFDDDTSLRLPPGQAPLCVCGMPKSNRVHDESQLAAATRAVEEAQAEERRRLGEED